MKFLFIHQNFPAQFKNIAPELARLGHEVVALTPRNLGVQEWAGVKIINYGYARASGTDLHPWLSDFEAKTIRGEACFRAALKLKEAGFTPDKIIAHPGWGESMFLKEVWPNARLGIYCEFYYNADGADVGFDPEHSNVGVDEGCRLKLRNINNLLNFEIADAGLSPTNWQKMTFPERFRDKISVIHEGIDTNLLRPNDEVQLNLGSGVELRKGDPIITFVNRNLEPYRGYHIFMRALPHILRKSPKARVIIVGGDEVSYGSPPAEGGSWKEIYLQEIKPLLTANELSRIHFVGKLDYAQFIAVLQISMVHIYLTYPFVLSWSLLEAMSIGCSVVASDTAPVREVIKHNTNGILVDFFDTAAVANKTLKLIENAETRSKLGRNAQTFIRKHYDLASACMPQSISWCLNF